MTPKQLLFALPLLCLAAIVNAQRTTYSAGLNSGIFNYTGDHALEAAGLGAAPYPRTLYDGVAGSKSGFSYEITANIQRLTRSKIIFGLELAWQSFQSKARIAGISPTIYSSYYMSAEGKTTLTSEFIGITPFAGYRLLDKKVKLDLTTGIEIAACISRKEHIKAVNTVSGEKLEGTNDLPQRPDYRARLQLNTSMGRFGLTTGYAAGFYNFYPSSYMLNAKSRFIRIGLNYRIN